MNRKGELWLDLGNPWNGVSSSSHPFCVSWTGRGTAQCCGTDTEFHELTVRSHLGNCCLVSLFPLLLVILLSAASASPLLNSDTFPSDICSSFALGPDLQPIGLGRTYITLLIHPFPFPFFSHCLMQHLLPFSLSGPSYLVHHLSAVHIHLLAIIFP